MGGAQTLYSGEMGKLPQKDSCTSVYMRLPPLVQGRQEKQLGVIHAG